MEISWKLGQWIVDSILNTRASLAIPVTYKLFINELSSLNLVINRLHNIKYIAFSSHNGFNNKYA